MSDHDRWNLARAYPERADNATALRISRPSPRPSHGASPRHRSRSVRPHNVLLDDDGNAFVADFGVMCARRGELRGERIRRRSGLGGFATPASDIYRSRLLLIPVDPPAD